jgi:hypothetical protein
MPLYATAPERFKREVQGENGTSENQPPHMHLKFNKVR